MVQFDKSSKQLTPIDENKVVKKNHIEEVEKKEQSLSNDHSNKKSFLKKINKLISWIDYWIDLLVNNKSKKYLRPEVVDIAREPIKFGLWVIIITFGIAGGWATLFPLDTASHAMGTIVLGSNKKSVHHLEGGIIKEIYVKNGQVIKKDQPLVELKNQDSKSNAEILRVHQYTLRAQESRLIAQRNLDHQINFSEVIIANLNEPKVKEVVESQKRIFESTMSSYNGRLNGLKKKIAQSNKQIEALKSRKEAAKKQLTFLDEKINSLKDLINKGYYAKNQIVELEVRHSAIQGELGEAEGQIARVGQEINGLEIEISNTKTDFLNDVSKELKDIEVKISENEASINTVADKRERLIITAPQDGIVHNFHYHNATGQIVHYTIGGVIQPGAQVMDIVPQDDELVVEAKINPKDIDAIDIGQTTKIKITAFKSRNTPDIIGKVIYISADVSGIDRDDKGRAMQYYSARIKIDKESFLNNPRLRNLTLYPGMQADVLIISDSRTFLKYLLDPILDSMRSSFNER